MKKIILLLVTIMASEAALASKARLNALGQDDDGSFLIRDNRNIFLNPAQVVILNNSFNFETGSTAGADPRAEGGMIYEAGSGKLALQLGRQSYVHEQIAEANAIAGIGDLLTPNNTIDVVYGGNQNSPWGVGVHYGAAKDYAPNNGYPRQDASELQVYGGIIKGKLEAFGQLGISAKSEEDTSATAKDEYEGGTYLRGGAAFQIDDVSKVFGTLTKMDYEVTPDTGVKTEVDAMIIEANYARTHRPKNDLMFFYGGGLRQQVGDSETGGTTTDNEELTIPVFLGIEGAATSWMDLRASVTQAVLLNSVENASGDNEHSPNTTTVGAGATLKFTNFTVDATLAAASAGSGDIDGASLFANASVLYNF